MYTSTQKYPWNNSKCDNKQNYERFSKTQFSIYLFEINELFALSYSKVQQSTVEFVFPSNELYELMVAMCTLINLVCIFIEHLRYFNDNDNINEFLWENSL